MADSESPSAASACSVIEGRRPGTGGSSSGGVTSDGPSTPATEGISTAILASPATTPAAVPQHMINTMPVEGVEREDGDGPATAVQGEESQQEKGSGVAAEDASLSK